MIKWLISRALFADITWWSWHCPEHKGCVRCERGRDVTASWIVRDQRSEEWAVDGNCYWQNTFVQCSQGTVRPWREESFAPRFVKFLWSRNILRTSFPAPKISQIKKNLICSVLSIKCTFYINRILVSFWSF